jgi:hypothetical protein
MRKEAHKLLTQKCMSNVEVLMERVGDENGNISRGLPDMKFR